MHFKLQLHKSKI